MPQDYATMKLVRNLRKHHPDVLAPEVEAPRAQGDPVNPHDRSGRKWFNRGLIAVCLLGFAVLDMPDSLRHRLNGWGRDHVTAARYAASYPTPITCATVKLTGLNLRCRGQEIRRCQQTVDGVLKYASEAC